MANLFRNAAIWLKDKREQYAIVNIAYSRNTMSVNVKCWIGKTFYDEMTDDGGIIRTESRDYHIAIDDLKYAGFDVPKVGDIITENINGVETRFRVLPLGGMTRYTEGSAFCYVRDPHFLTYKIFTKRISEEV